MSKVVFFMESYTAGGLDRVCRDIILNLNADNIFLLVNNTIDERIIKTEDYPSKVSVVKYKLVTPVDLSIFASQHAKNKMIYVVLKAFDYFMRYPLLFFSFFYFYYFLKKINYDKFITHNGGYPAALYCGIASFASAIVKKEKSFYVFHSMPRKYIFAYFGIDYLWDKLIDKYCIIISVSKNAAIELLKVRKIKQSPIVIYNGIDCREKKNCDFFDEIKLLHIGYILDSKNQIMLLKALNILVNKNKLKVTVTFIGEIADYKYKNELDKYIVENRLNNSVNFEGFRVNIDDYYYKNNILVCTSKVESFPMVILEAMRIGVPVISTKVGGIPEQVVDGIDGFLVNLEDYKTLAQKIILLSDKNIYEKFSNNAHNSFNSKFRKTYMIERYNRVLNLKSEFETTNCNYQ